MTGSFKVRGAVNRLAVLTEDERRRGVVTASTGNHGAAVAFAASALSDPSQPLQCEIFLPKNVSRSKLDRLGCARKTEVACPVVPSLSFYCTVRSSRSICMDDRRCGALTRLVDTVDCEVAETRARQVADETNRVFVSPYNDMLVIAGQGTMGVEIGHEMARLHHQVDAVLVPVGGGGLVSGVAAAIKAQYPACKVFGCQPHTNACMAESVKAGRVLREGEFRNDPTWSDGTAGGVEEGALTFDACSTLVDEFLLVSEEAILDAMALMMTRHHKIVEGAAGVALGAFMANTALFVQQNVVIISCGSNLGPERILKVAERAVQLEEHADE